MQAPIIPELANGLTWNFRKEFFWFPYLNDECLSVVYIRKFLFGFILSSDHYVYKGSIVNNPHRIMVYGHSVFVCDPHSRRDDGTFCGFPIVLHLHKGGRSWCPLPTTLSIRYLLCSEWEILSSAIENNTLI